MMPGDPLIGKTLGGRYEVLATIGSGGMATVYRARELALDRLVALKVLRPASEGEPIPGLADRFAVEAKVTAQLRHPNTVTLYDYGTLEGVPFMALELLEGLTLQQVMLRDRRLSWTRALSIGAQVARALREAHTLGLVHRDLKPSNIMLLSEGALGERVKLLDFGLVKSMGSTDALEASAPPEMTDKSLVLGSPPYMAPEQIRRVADPRGDVYSLGAVLYAAMAGRPPFVADKSFELIMKHLHDAPPELSSLVEVPPVVNAVVMRCLEKAPECRFQSMEELLVSMHHTVNGLGFGGLLVTERRSFGLPSPISGLHPVPARTPPLREPPALASGPMRTTTTPLQNPVARRTSTPAQSPAATPALVRTNTPLQSPATPRSTPLQSAMAPRITPRDSPAAPRRLTPGPVPARVSPKTPLQNPAAPRAMSARRVPAPSPPWTRLALSAALGLSGAGGGAFLAWLVLSPQAAQVRAPAHLPSVTVEPSPAAAAVPTTATPIPSPALPQVQPPALAAPPEGANAAVEAMLRPPPEARTPSTTRPPPSPGAQAAPAAYRADPYQAR